MTVTLMRVLILSGMAVVIVLLVILICIARRAYLSLHGFYNLEHDLLTPVRTIKGLVQALEVGLEGGGLRSEQRSAIYKAIDEQIARFEEKTQIARAANIARRT